tara:strand:- start:41 stop:934 length:894 start_codon:yes stop_codon:yes gene_type:complete
VSDAMTKLSCLWDGAAELGEGVFWHAPEQAVYWVDIFQSNLHRLHSNGSTQSWHFPGQISAAVPCDSGGLMATFENGLSHLDLETATVTPLVTLESELPDNRFNDGCSDTRGQFWFCSMDIKQQDPSGRFYRLDRSGEIHHLPSFGQISVTNGPAFSTDGQWVYFTDTLEKKVYRAELDDTGVPGSPALYIDFVEEEGFPDGMCTDTNGGLWVCHFAGGRVTRFYDGKVDRFIEMPVPNITKCAFGGANMSTLYISTATTALDDEQRKAYPLAGGLFAIDLPFQGVGMGAVSRPVVG